MCGRLVRVFAIDLVPEFVRTGRAHEEVSAVTPKPSRCHAYHATRADLLRRLGRSQKSRAAYGKAIELAGNTAETASLTRRRDQLG
jgi:predicted RNA polymerase sigma factor